MLNWKLKAEASAYKLGTQQPQEKAVCNRVDKWLPRARPVQAHQLLYSEFPNLVAGEAELKESSASSALH